MCVESRGHDSPHREQSKIDAVVPQLQFDYGYMGSGGPLQIACCGSKHLFLSHPRDDGAGLEKDGHAPRCRGNSQIGCVTWGVHSTQKIKNMRYNQFLSDPSTCVKKRAQRSKDSIFLRHMDDVVGTGPDEHLMSDFEHMKTSLYLTDVMMLRRVGDIVNFLGFEITKTHSAAQWTRRTQTHRIRCLTIQQWIRVCSVSNS